MAVTQPRLSRRHHAEIVLLATLLIAALIFLLWITKANGGDPSLAEKLLPWMRSRPYGPGEPLFSGWMWVVVAAAIGCIVGPLLAYVLYRGRRKIVPSQEPAD
ncbi:MAG TPA: hypothetical protein VLV55_09315 [Rhizomicrobium sp.]|nr:hypothetical protein [Rhizomicrobium sp.]